MLSALLISTTLLTPTAEAGKCDAYLRRADSASGASLISTFNALAKCDPKAAEDNFVRFMTRATDADTLSQLSLAAISVDVWNPVWSMPGKIKDYEARDLVTNQIGEACADNEKVSTFLQGAYAGIREVDFARWEDAMVSCEQEGFGAWITAQIEAPPAKAFDGKFDTLVKVFLERNEGASALPHLQTGAIAAASNGGPYDRLIQAMTEAVSPTIGDISAEGQAALTEAMVAVAGAVPADKAKGVADALANAGNESAAASLLPVVFSDRVQPGGGFLYGAAAIEAGECKGGVQSAVVHFAPLSESGERYTILIDDAAPLRSSKPRLKKCASEGDWALRVSNEPLADGSAVRAWVEGLEQELVDKGYEVSVRAESGIEIN